MVHIRNIINRTRNYYILEIINQEKYMYIYINHIQAFCMLHVMQNKIWYPEE